LTGSTFAAQSGRHNHHVRMTMPKMNVTPIVESTTETPSPAESDLVDLARYDLFGQFTSELSALRCALTVFCKGRGYW
jgi:hypothetical protein